MPGCSIVFCRARKNKNQPELTLHRFPKNERLKKKWLDSIGEENISPQSKNWSICSLHFEEKCFNRTLNVIRLHENSVPTIFSTSNKKPLPESFEFCDTSNTQESDISCASTVIDEPSTVMEAPLQLTHQFVGTVHKEVLQTGKIKTFREKYVKQQKTIKLLNERIRRRNKKISDLKDIIKDLRRNNCINVEQAVVTDDLAGPKDFLKRQINKSKGLPVPNKYNIYT